MAGEARYCPWCITTLMNYDAATGMYTCPDCGHVEFESYAKAELAKLLEGDTE